MMNSKQQMSPGLNYPGKLVKLSEMDIQSETRSVYKLDPTSSDVGGNYDLGARSRQGPNNLESIFKNMDVVDRAQILDKIHKMRMNVADRNSHHAAEPVKPFNKNTTSGNVEKDKIMEQYYAVKRQIKPENK